VPIPIYASTAVFLPPVPEHLYAIHSAWDFWHRGKCALQTDAAKKQNNITYFPNTFHPRVNTSNKLLLKELGGRDASRLDIVRSTMQLGQVRKGNPNVTKAKKGKNSKFKEMMASMKFDTPEKYEALIKPVVEAALKRSTREFDEPSTVEELEEAEALQNQRRASGKKALTSPSQLRGVSTKNKVIRALTLLGRQSLAVSMSKCQPRSRCSSFYCEYCRNRAAQNLADRVTRRVAGYLKNDANAVQKRFRFVTVLHEVVDFEESSVSASVERCRTQLNAFHRRFPNVWIQGAFEFELIDVDHLKKVTSGNGKIKSETIHDMMTEGKHATSAKGLKILVHFHAIIDLIDGDVASDVSRWLRAHWCDHPRQVDVKPTFKGQPLEEKVWKLSSYCFKNRTQFNDTFETRDFELGKDFTNEELGKLVSLYQDFLDAGSGSIRGLYISRGNKS
jgi:hypothetical protein